MPTMWLSDSQSTSPSFLRLKQFQSSRFRSRSLKRGVRTLDAPAWVHDLMEGFREYFANDWVL